MKLSKPKKIIAIILAIVIPLGAVATFLIINAPPKYEEIAERVEELLEKSEEVNVILFGKGLPTYERVEDPKANLNIYHTGEFTDSGEDKKPVERTVYYYRTLDEREIYAFRDSFKNPFAYIYVSKPLSDGELDKLKEDFPIGDDDTAPDGKIFYDIVYDADKAASDKTDEDDESKPKSDGRVAYLIPYTEKKYDFYYSASSLSDYDYVRSDAKYRSMEEIRTLAKSIYSLDYFISIEPTLFDGVESHGSILKPRFSDSADGYLLQTNNPDDVLFTEHLVYKYDTAKIIIWGSNRKNVRISIEAYRPSNPDKIITTEVQISLNADKVWLLKSPTF